MMMSGVAPVARVKMPTGDPAGLLASGLCRRRRRIARVFHASTSGRRNPLIRARAHGQFRLQTRAQAHAPTPMVDVGAAVVIRAVEVAPTMAIARRVAPVDRAVHPLALHEKIPMKAPRILRHHAR